jgi:VanZ family protein
VLAVSQLEHVAPYALTTVALVLGYPGHRAPRAILLLLTFYAALMELAQLFIPGRTASLIDIAAGGLGAGIGAMLVLLLRRTRCEPPGAGPT